MTLTAPIIFAPPPGRVAYQNLTPPELYEHAVRRGEGVIAANGPFCACRRASRR